MAVRFALSTCFPDRTPAWSEVFVGALALLQVGSSFFAFSLPSWSAFILGFIVGIVALGPAANSSIGKSVGSWFRQISLVGRTTTIISVLLIVGVGFYLNVIPGPLVRDAALGSLLAGATYVAAHVVWAGEVSGWLAT